MKRSYGFVLGIGVLSLFAPFAQAGEKLVMTCATAPGSSLADFSANFEIFSVKSDPAERGWSVATIGGSITYRKATQRLSHDNISGSYRYNSSRSQFELRLGQTFAGLAMISFLKGKFFEPKSIEGIDLSGCKLQSAYSPTLNAKLTQGCFQRCISYDSEDGGGGSYIEAFRFLPSASPAPYASPSPSPAPMTAVYGFFQFPVKECAGIPNFKYSSWSIQEAHSAGTVDVPGASPASRFASDQVFTRFGITMGTKDFTDWANQSSYCDRNTWKPGIAQIFSDADARKIKNTGNCYLTNYYQANVSNRYYDYATLHTDSLGKVRMDVSTPEVGADGLTPQTRAYKIEGKDPFRRIPLAGSYCLK
jgi:hypothetical protein